MFRLVIKSGTLNGQSADVTAQLVLGREGADLNLPDPHISRRHAVVLPTPSGLRIEDLGSANGTFVNGTRIHEATPLTSGDTVRLGQCSLVVEIDDQPSDRTVVFAEPVGASATAPPQASSHASTVPFSPPTVLSQGGVASRRVGPTMITFSAIAVTAVVLVLYFWLR